MRASMESASSMSDSSAAVSATARCGSSYRTRLSSSIEPQTSLKRVWRTSVVGLRRVLLLAGYRYHASLLSLP